MTTEPENKGTPPEGSIPNDPTPPAATPEAPAPDAAPSEGNTDTPAPDAPKEPDATDADSETIDYVDYGNETANAVVSMLKESKVTAKEADAFFRAAIEADDLSKINVDELTKRVGKEKATLIMVGLKDYYGTITQSTKEVVSAVHSEVGGDKNWDTITAWAREKSKVDTEFAKTVEEYNKMFDLNKTAALFAAKELKAQYEKDPNNSSLVTKQLTGDSAYSANANFEPLTRAEYLKQTKAAYEKNDFATVASLRQQRTFTKTNYNY